MDYAESFDEEVLQNVEIGTVENKNVNKILVGKKIWGLLDEKCMRKIVYDYEYEKTCLVQFTAEILNIVIMMGSLLVKIPQIFLVVKSSSVEGLSETSFLIEVLGGSLYVAYNIIEKHPFMNWGECAFVVIQSIILVVLYWLYAERKAEQFSIFQRSCFVFSFVMLMFFILFFELPVFCVAILGLSPVPISVLARFPQIILNYKQKNTGNLSLITTFLMFIGNLTRLFTTLAQIDDSIMLISIAVACISNGIPLLQIVYYRENTRKSYDKKRDKKIS